jgi:hypothetical protein
MTMRFDYYRLPDGRVVPVDATASKAAKTIGFTEIGGRIVTATLVSPAAPEFPAAVTRALFGE